LTELAWASPLFGVKGGRICDKNEKEEAFAGTVRGREKEL
jgi:hypothetical protein